MRVLYSMLKELLPPVPEPEDLREIFGRIGLEVEGFRDLSEGLSGKLVAGIVMDIKTEGRLKILTLSTGRDSINSVTTSAVEKGEVLVLATPGTRLPDGTVIEKRVIRGHPSEAMPLSEQELGLSDASDSVIRLGEGVLRPGDDPLDYLGLRDWLFDLYVFPNRGDLMGAWGIARELAPLAGESPSLPGPELEEDPDIGLYPVDIEAPDACPRYVARLIKNTSITASPAWMRHRLSLLGQRPINNVVDASNYVLFWLGHPTHTFDTRHLSGGIVVRWARDGESMLMLDETERSFDPETLMIADEEKPLAVAGIMGGEGSGVHDDTEDVLIESAYFHPPVIARTSRRLGVITESSRRFERGTDPLIAPLAGEWVARFIQETGGGVAGPANDIRTKEFSRHRISLSLAWLRRFSGAEIPPEEALGIARALDLHPQLGEGLLEVHVPPRRHDLLLKEDVAEDILKFWGYDNLAQDVPTISRTRGEASEGPLDRAVRVLAGAGLFEARTPGLHGPRELDAWGFDPETLVRVSNPLGEEFSVLRPSLLPGLARALAGNLNRGREGLGLFEAGPSFAWRGPEDLPEERWLLGLAFGGTVARRPGAPERDMGPGDLRGALDILFRAAGQEFSMRRAKRPFLSPASTWEILCGGEVWGVAGALSRDLLPLYNLKKDVWVAELRPPEFAPRRYEPIPRFPPVKRDIAVLVDEGVPFQEILEGVKEAAEGPVRLEPMDVYRGKSIPPGKVSYGFSLSYSHPERTLRDEEVDVWFGSLVKNLEKRGYHIRGKEHAG